MIERCLVHECKVQRDSDSVECQSTLDHYPDGLLCEEHGCQYNRLQAELPMAIMEFHAWTLLYPDIDAEQRNGRFRWMDDLQKARQQVHAARDRVTRLRDLEALLKGEGG
jgi:hypothetical protein